MMRNLLTHPISRPEELGDPIPASPHAVSVALPRWQDVVDYEENRPDLVARLRGGYPRFVIRPQVRSLARRLGGDRPCLPFPSARVAQRCADFVQAETNAETAIVHHGSVCAVVTSDAGAAALQAFWQHTGLIVSTRRAVAVLEGRGDPDDAGGARAALCTKLAALYECAPSDVFLAPTGMAAHDTALRAVMTASPSRATVQLGFPYVDALKLQQKLGHGAVLLHDLSTAPAVLRALLERESVAACFCEMPCNPLLGSVDLRLVSPPLRNKGVVLIVDDVLSSPVNTALGDYADLIVTSLTKFIAGAGDVMGGAVVCNPRSPRHDELHAIMAGQHENLLWGEDAAALEVQARAFEERMHRHNENGLIIAERLRAHPAVARVWYPKWECGEAYEAVRRANGGYGALVSFLTHRAPETAPRVYDLLEVCKGPSLGTVFTLACPFTLMAHYRELEWAESCGVPRHLIRLSVGLEDPDDLWRRIERALAA